MHNTNRSCEIFWSNIILLVHKRKPDRSHYRTDTEILNKMVETKYNNLSKESFIVAKYGLLWENEGSSFINSRMERN